MSKIIVKEMDLAGRKLRLEAGFLAQQADFSVVASWGDSVVLCTVATQPSEEPVDYFPLSVEYVEKYYAGGRITAQKFIKRETRPPEDAILAARAIDRAIRPLFPKEFTNSVQVIVTVLSFDGISDPAILGFIAASAALSASSIPWRGPIGVVEIGSEGDKEIIFPTLLEKGNLDFDLTVAATAEKVVMIEAMAKQSPDEVIYQGIEKAYQANQPFIKLINEFVKEVGKEKLALSPAIQEIEEALAAEIKTEVKKKIGEALASPTNAWHEATGDLIKKELAAKYKDVATPQIISGVFDKVAKELMHDLVLNKGQRVDGRSMEEVRPIEIKVGILPRTHGSAVFQRGRTQVLSIVTLGPVSASQILEGMTGESTKRYMHHYNMGVNPFSVGEVKRLGAPSRRDVGHGALAEKALLPVLPTEEQFPYAIRVVSEVLAASASTSMASACAASLALQSAGVALKNPVAGIALGLLWQPERYQVITDMQAVEDFYGDMDFKITGTREGITAIQMDTKLDGLSFDIIQEALRQGSLARGIILAKMNQALPVVGEISQYAPKIEVIKIKPEDIGSLIGPGGRNINGLIARYGAQIDVTDDGTVMVSSVDEEAVKATVAQVRGLFAPVEIGQIFAGKVVNIMPFGAFVEIVPGRDGLVHVSQMAPYRVERPEDIVKLGQEVKVRVVEVTAEGKIGLSMLFGNDQREPQERSNERRGFDNGPRRHRFGSR